jgi:4-carboxymuconolactone decarboxylase
MANFDAGTPAYCVDNGLTQTEAAEVITHLAFYAGWPNAFSALPLAKAVFEKPPK